MNHFSSDPDPDPAREQAEDERLVLAAAGGDVDAFAELVRNYTNAVCAIAYDVMRDYHLAQDIAQESFVKAYRSLQSLQQPGKFGSWLYAIAMNLSIDYKRSQARKTRTYDQLESMEAAERKPSADDRLLQQELRLDVGLALDHLDETSRTILLSYYISEMTMPEIAGMLDMSVSAVESRVRRSRKTLQSSHLSAYARQYGNRGASDKLVMRVMDRIVKQAGQFYIPVSDRSRSTAWFVTHLGLSLDSNGHVCLPSGQALFMVHVSDEVLAERSQSAIPVLVFSVEDTAAFYQAIIGQGIRAVRESSPEMAGELVLFYDPDGNCYGACSP
ncbi:sigma-70 family RNA polymerase sigma factor [Paenibacillus kobensis]|uniref:sigma-70 family RNA polymerase sigma factor n=1 Tax=Paenibacillus kobensis TaxID=59841 RepID=UPI0013E2CB8C|nr:sigma-70 family RNA polymerase sigma factor [Paenibacillus kobensis]